MEEQSLRTKCSESWCFGLELDIDIASELAVYALDYACPHVKAWWQMAVGVPEDDFLEALPTS